MVKNTEKCLMQKYDLQIDQLDYKFIGTCKDKKVLERILLVLRSGQEGFYPDLTKFCENRLREVAPESKLFEVATRIKRYSDLSENEKRDLENQLESLWSDTEDQDRHKERSVPLNKDMPPIRGKSVRIETTKKKEETVPFTKKGKTGCAQRSYSDWEKFDVDGELKKLEESEENNKVKSLKDEENNRKSNAGLEKLVSVSDLTEKERQYVADLEKNKGNEAFKSHDYEEAIVYYTRSLSAYKSIVTLNNRAQAYIKLKNYFAAIQDCNKVLLEDSNNLKALYRRGIALKESRMFDLAELDFKTLLEIDAENKSAKEQLKQVKQLKMSKPEKKKVVIEEIKSDEAELARSEEEEVDNVKCTRMKIEEVTETENVEKLTNLSYDSSDEDSNASHLPVTVKKMLQINKATGNQKDQIKEFTYKNEIEKTPIRENIQNKRKMKITEECEQFPVISSYVDENESKENVLVEERNMLDKGKEDTKLVRIDIEDSNTNRESYQQSGKYLPKSKQLKCYNVDNENNLKITQKNETDLHSEVNRKRMMSDENISNENNIIIPVKSQTRNEISGGADFNCPKKYSIIRKQKQNEKTNAFHILDENNTVKNSETDENEMNFQSEYMSVKDEKRNITPDFTNKENARMTSTSKDKMRKFQGNTEHTADEMIFDGEENLQSSYSMKNAVIVISDENSNQEKLHQDDEQEKNNKEFNVSISFKGKINVQGKFINENKLHKSQYFQESYNEPNKINFHREKDNAPIDKYNRLDPEEVCFINEDNHESIKSHIFSKNEVFVDKQLSRLQTAEMNNGKETSFFTDSQKNIPVTSSSMDKVGDTNSIFGEISNNLPIEEQKSRPSDSLINTKSAASLGTHLHQNVNKNTFCENNKLQTDKNNTDYGESIFIAEDDVNNNTLHSTVNSISAAQTLQYKSPERTKGNEIDNSELSKYSVEDEQNLEYSSNKTAANKKLESCKINIKKGDELLKEEFVDVENIHPALSKYSTEDEQNLEYSSNKTAANKKLESCKIDIKKGDELLKEEFVDVENIHPELSKYSIKDEQNLEHSSNKTAANKKLESCKIDIKKGDELLKEEFVDVENIHPALSKYSIEDEQNLEHSSNKTAANKKLESCKIDIKKGDELLKEEFVDVENIHPLPGTSNEKSQEKNGEREMSQHENVTFNIEKENQKRNENSLSKSFEGKTENKDYFPNKKKEIFIQYGEEGSGDSRKDTKVTKILKSSIDEDDDQHEKVSPYEFLCTWCLNDDKDVETRALNLLKLKPEELPRIISNKIDASMLAGILKAISNICKTGKCSECQNYLYNLSQVPRIHIAAMFLTEEEIKNLQDIFSELQNEHAFHMEQINMILKI